MSFIVPSPPSETADPVITSSAFFPAINPSQIRDAQRIDNTVTNLRLRAVLVEAIASTNAALRRWREARQAEGIAALADVPAEQVDKVSIHVHRYTRAVGCLAKALLLERYRDFDSTAKGDKKADLLSDPIDDCRRDHHNALADIIGTARTTVELI